ncbi:MAG: SDR family oxidoreductase [Bacilli bacterium]|nr:SDR family oxidoreductase [Bacilli bacterium]
MKDLKNKVFILTGAGSGMGRELTFQLLDKGVIVAAVDINEAALLETFKLANVDNKKLSIHVVDVSKPDQLLSLPEAVIKLHGKIDGLINNAGIIQPMVRFAELEEKTAMKVIEINTFGVFNLTRNCLPYILKSDEGFIVNVSSMGGFLPVPGQAIYGASKAAVKLFTEALYAELYDTNVNVSVVFPGAIETNISQNSGLEMPKDSSEMKIKTTKADVAAAIIINGIEKGKLRIFVGKDAKMMDKLYRLTPVKAIKLMQKMLKGILN